MYPIFAIALAVSIYRVMSETPGEDIHFRSRRQLLFPNTTLLQFNAGVGTPTPIKTINVNWAFQANFMLPWNRSQIPIDILEANSGYDRESRRERDVNYFLDREYENDAKLYHFYKFVEDVVNGFGDNGTACVLQTLCQIGAEPLHSDAEDLLHEIASYVLNPTNDLSLGFNEEDPHIYVAAYEKGQNGQECIGEFGSCTTALVDMFSILHDSVDQF